VTARVVVDLLRPTLRAMSWGPPLTAVAVGLGIVAVPMLLEARLDAANLTTLLRLTAVCAALGGAFLLDDPAARMIAATPTPRLVRQALRVGAILPLFAAAWWTATAMAGTLGGRADLLIGGLTVEAAALLAAALSVAAVWGRHDRNGAAGPAAATGTLVAAALGAVVTSPVAVFPSPDDPNWNRIHLGWAAALVIAVGVVVWAASGRRHPWSTGGRRRV